MGFRYRSGSFGVSLRGAECLAGLFFACADLQNDTEKHCCVDSLPYGEGFARLFLFLFKCRAAA